MGATYNLYGQSILRFNIGPILKYQSNLRFNIGPILKYQSNLRFRIGLVPSWHTCLVYGFCMRQS